ncbi:hypothetical protein LCGC14_1987890 [marine sediment metagenome]|uniref:Uncharacterized protein n=1 Tax=marine sediment metagenome TaxID=412755 RepID=A0A0F9HKA9_9ZZZZ
MAECKHKFQPRYSRKWTSDVQEAATTKCAWSGLDGRSYLKEEMYVCDICIKCGVKK